jgi:hypothetical protein
LVAALDAPVRRYFNHAIQEGAVLARWVRLRMEGRIKAGAWLSFTAEEECDVDSFEWRARVGLGPLRPLHVVDRFERGAGGTEGRLLGRARLFRANDEDTARAAAARAGAEGLVFAPSGALPSRGIRWRAESEDTIVASWKVPPERLEVTLEIADEGRVRCLSLARWGKAGKEGYRYIPFGVEFRAERRFGNYVLPSRLEAGWWFRTPRYAPFFEAEVTDLSPLDEAVTSGGVRPASG